MVGGERHEHRIGGATGAHLEDVVRRVGEHVGHRAGAAQSGLSATAEGARVLVGGCLDLGLPRLAGFEVLQRLRERRLRVPVLILTARDAIEVVGVLSHFANIEDTTDHGFAESQIAAFARLMRIATVTTPNLPELAALGPASTECMIAASVTVRASGPA